MNRRLFLKNAAIDATALAGGLMPFNAASQAGDMQRPRRKNWVWIGSDEKRPVDEWKR